MSTKKPKKPKEAAPKNTKNLGERDVERVRLSEGVAAHLEAMAVACGVPRNVIVNMAIVLLASQTAPLRAGGGLSLDVLDEEVRFLLADAKRVVSTVEAPLRKVAKTG